MPHNHDIFKREMMGEFVPPTPAALPAPEPPKPYFVLSYRHSVIRDVMTVDACWPPDRRSGRTCYLAPNMEPVWPVYEDRDLHGRPPGTLFVIWDPYLRDGERRFRRALDTAHARGFTVLTLPVTQEALDHRRANS